MNDKTEIITELKDLRYLTWSKTRHSSGTAGSFLKSYDDTGKKKLYYKLSDFDVVRGVVGHECVNEIIVQRLLDLFQAEHLSYRLINAIIAVDDRDYETWLCESDDYKENGEKKLALEDYYEAEKMKNESPLEFCVRMGWGNLIYKMLVVDYIVLNRDRHGANLEVLRLNGSGNVRLAPLFDHGLSLCCSCHTVEELKTFDVMKDRKVQSFLASNSAEQNLELVPHEILESIPHFENKYKKELFNGLDVVLQKEYLDKIWKMISGRWKQVETFRDKR